MMKSGFFWALVICATMIAAIDANAGAQTVGSAAATAGVSAAEGPGRNSSAHAVSDSTHRYDVQALRLESSWGNVSIIRGADGPVIGTAGWFRNFDVEKLVAKSPSALSDARAYRRNNLQGSIAGGLGALTLAVGVIVAANSSNNASSPILIIAGAGAMAWGAQHVSMAYSALSRSLWWYNRDLAR